MTNHSTTHVMLMISSLQGGGSEQQTLLLLRHLDRTRFTPHLYLTSATGSLMSQIPDDVQVHAYSPGDGETGNRKTENRKLGFYYPGRVLRDQVHHFAKLIETHSIDVIYDRTFHMTMIAGPAAKAKGVPRVSTIVSPPDRALPLVEKRFVRLKRRRLAQSYRDSKKVIAVSLQAATSAREYYRLPESLVEVVTNPVDREALIAASSSANITSMMPSPSAITLACVGRMTSEKGHADLMEALTQIKPGPSIAIWFIGDGPLRSDLERSALGNLKQHQIHFMGHQSHVPAWIAAADGLILPSHFEGMPNVVLEAMAIGKPVIATRAGGTVELQGDQPTMFMADAGDPASLAKAMERFREEPSTRERHVQTATEWIHQHHDIHKTTRQIESILDNAAQ